MKSIGLQSSILGINWYSTYIYKKDIENGGNIED